jgi:2-keto-4-pentenoate hydratase/2-oxohepta-3-ene-1,7-dioic acid hydratase in catechol pathway
VVFCKSGSNIAVEEAMDYVAGFCVGNDVSERVFQLERGTQWTKGKSADTLKPLGPWLVTTDEVGDPNNLDISLRINGQIMQQSNTSDMMYSIAELVSIISNYVSWQPGDVMMTGTPPGVGYGMKPQQYLKPGDIMEAQIEKLGAQRNIIVASRQ